MKKKFKKVFRSSIYHEVKTYHVKGIGTRTELLLCIRTFSSMWRVAGVWAAGVALAPGVLSERFTIFKKDKKNVNKHIIFEPVWKFTLETDNC